MRILVFGYHRENPPVADLTIDVRRLNDPERHQQYRMLTGKHPEIQEYVRRSSGFDKLWADILAKVVAKKEEVGDATVVIAIGCAFGKHRSRAVAHMLREHVMKEWGLTVAPIEPYVFKDGRTD